MPVGSGPTNPDLVLDVIRKGATFERSAVYPDYGVLRPASGPAFGITPERSGWTTASASYSVVCVFSEATWRQLRRAAAGEIHVTSEGYLVIGEVGHALEAREVSGVPVAELVVSGPLSPVAPSPGLAGAR